MNEELKVVIKAEVDKLKKGIDDAKKQMSGFKEQVQKASGDVDSKMKKMGESIGKAVKTGAKVAVASIATVTTAVASVVTASVKSYAEYEQLAGGVEKLFGKSAKTIMKYANSAYKDAGINANQYMTQVTSFSASLISSLNGDTAKSAEVANTAIKDMSDNANVFGTNIQDIQNAYQGFAKQNYTMLDNLKLGYGGTKEEMQRLIEDANKVKKANGELANLSINSFSDVIEAIHTMQGEMKITGTTAKEAEGTISGSIQMTKSAWDNLITGLAQGNANIPQLVQNVISSATSVIKNIIPIVKEVLQNIPVAISEINPKVGEAFKVIIDGCTSAFTVLVEVAKNALTTIASIFSFVQQYYPILVGIATVIGVITTAIGLYNVVSAVKTAMDVAQVTTLGALISAYMAQAVAMMVALAPYILIVAAIGAVIAIIVLCIKHWDKIKATVTNVAKIVKEKVVAMVNAVKEKFNAMKSAIGTVIDNIKSTVSSKFNAVKNTITTIITAIKSVVSTIFGGIKSTISTIINGIKTHISLTFSLIKAIFTGDFGAVKGIVSNIFNNIKNTISKVMDTAKNTVKNVIDKIKGFFKNCKLSLPKIKLPKISISGKFSINPPSVPKFSISWHKLGGVFDNPTLFNYGNSLHGLGEDGAEAIVPLEKNTQWLDKIAEKLSEKQGNTPIILQVDGKTFAQISVDSINSLTKQTGKLPLKLA